jgi:UDP-glucose 4-epimerase
MGPTLIKKLLNSGHTVRTIDNFWRGKKESLDGLNVEFVEGDIRNPEDVKSVMHGIDIVFHLAAQPSVPLSEIESNYTEQANVTGTRLLLSSARKEGVKNFIFYSTMGVFGNVSNSVITEDTALNPTAQSSITKAAGEFLCKSFWLNYQLPIVILRYGVVYGDSQGLQYFDEFHSTLPNRAVFLALSKKPITVYGNGNQTRGFIHIEDAANLAMLVMNKKEIQGEAFNAYSEVLTVNSLVETIKNVIQSQEKLPVEIQYISNPRIEEVNLPYTGSLEKIKTKLGFNARHTLAAGISELIHWLKEKGLVCK